VYQGIYETELRVESQEKYPNEHTKKVVKTFPPAFSLYPLYIYKYVGMYVCRYVCMYVCLGKCVRVRWKVLSTLSQAPC